MPEVAGASPDLLDGLNDAQRLAVLATEGPTLIVAGAGSGKTRVLTHRIAHLIKDQRVPPTSILAITFTNKAAREMQERLRQLVGPVVKAMWVSTFHSACVRILRRSGSHLGYSSTFSIYDEGDAERLMTQVCRQLDYDPKRLSARSMRHAVSGWKDQLVDPLAAGDRAMGWFEKKAAEAYRLYQQKLVESNAMDFDDLILQTVRLFQEHPDVLASWQQRFRYVLVDEFQDTNVAQYELLKLVAAEHRNLSVVGDGDQSIYAFRGATVRNILDFEADYPEANVILLEQNYRSTQTILSAANAVIANNLERKPKNLWTAIGSGNPIVRYQAENEHDEAAYVVEEVERLHDQGLGYGKVVVFYRTNAQSRPLEEVFVKAGLPYKIVGGVKFYDRREVKDLLAYLKATVNPLDTVSLRRVLNVPRRGIGDTSERAIDRFATEEGIPRITADLEARGLGGPAVNFRLRDWLLSRQRYWGCPIPIVHCPACGEVPVPDDQLPVLLPDDVTDFRPKGLSPLATSEAWVNVDCPRCGGPARRETDTMDTFVDSSWYFLRYTGLDPDRPFDPERVATWMPVHQYTGGIEHAILHLLYARFFTKVLYDMGLVGFTEPFTSLLNQGMVVMHGAAMSKSRGNLVEPSAIIDEHGADVARLTMLFAGPFEDDVDWADVSPEGMARWIQRVWRSVHAAVADPVAGSGEPGWPADPELERLAHRTTAGVTDDLERFRFNTAISKLMVLSNGLADAIRTGRGTAAQRRDAAERLVLLLAPLAPFITEELWRGPLGGSVSVHVSPWPGFDPALVRSDQVTCVVQVDGKLRDRLQVAPDAAEADLRALALASEKVQAALAGRELRRVVVVPPKLVNLVTGR